MEIVNYILSEALRNGKLSATLNAEGMKYKDVLCVFGSVNDNVFTLSIEGLKFIVAGGFNGLKKTIEVDSKLKELESILTQAHLEDIPEIRKTNKNNTRIAVIAIIVAVLSPVFVEVLKHFLF